MDHSMLSVRLSKLLNNLIFFTTCVFMLFNSFSFSNSLKQDSLTYWKQLKCSSFDDCVKLELSKGPYTLNTITVKGFCKNIVNIDIESSSDKNSSDRILIVDDAFQLTFNSPNNNCCKFISIETKASKQTINIFFLPTELGCFLSSDSYEEAYNSYLLELLKLGRISTFDYDAYNASFNNDSVIEDICCDDSVYNRGMPEIIINGSFYWTDPEENVFPLRYTYVELLRTTTNSYIVMDTTYTNAYGNYYFSVDVLSFPTSIIQNVFVRVYAKGINSIVYRNIPYTNYYYYDTSTIFTSNDILHMTYSSTYNLSHTFLDDGINSTAKIGNAMQISQAIIFGELFSYTMEASRPTVVNVEYPNNDHGLDGAWYDYVSIYKGIYLGNNVYCYWDVILHELGHKISEWLDLSTTVSGSPFHSLYDEHVEGTSYNDISNGLRFAWNEAWPTFFAKLVISYYSSQLNNLAYYSNYEYIDESTPDDEINYDLENNFNNNPCNYYGDGQEGNIIQVLYDIFDNDSSESFDNITVSYQNLWNLSKNSEAKTFLDFTQYCYNSELFSLDDYSCLLSEYGMAPVITQFGMNSINNTPTLFWYKANNGRSDKYTLQIFDANDNLLLQKTNLSQEYYVLTIDEWHYICTTDYRQFKIRVLCYDTDYSTTEFYSSKKSIFNKPYNNIQDTITYYSSTRLVEKPILLTPGSSALFDITFQNSGHKIIQTLGSTDTKITIYDSQNVILDFDDDDGYGYNAFLNKSLNANTHYKIKVEGYNQSIGGKTRLIVTESNSFASSGNQLDEYQHICHINSDNLDYYTYNIQYTTGLYTYTPLTSDTHTISLTSVFDNYLYVLDPRNGEAMQSGVEYNDDWNGLNAMLSVNLSNQVSYLIIFSQYDPSEPFINLNEGDDCKISFRTV